MKDRRIEKFKMCVGDAERKNALDFKHLIYTTLKDFDSDRRCVTKNDLETKMGLIHAIRYIYCVELGINPECIKIDFADDMSKITKKDDSIAIAHLINDLEKDYDKYFAKIVFSTNSIVEYSPILFAYIVAHEMHHIYQKMLRVYGRFAFSSANRNVRYGTEFEKQWTMLLYDVSLCEFDANLTSLKNMLRWIDEVESAGLEPVGGLNQLKGIYKDLQNEFIKKYVADSGKTGGFVLFHWMELLLSGAFNVFAYDERVGNTDSVAIYKRNVKNFLIGARSSRFAVKNSERLKSKAEISPLDIIKYCESKVILLAKKYGVNPLSLGLIFVKDGDKGVRFIDCSDAKEKRLIGCVKINAESLFDLDKQGFIMVIDEYMNQIEKDQGFLQAVKRYHQEKSKRKIAGRNNRSGEIGEE